MQLKDKLLEGAVEWSDSTQSLQDELAAAPMQTHSSHSEDGHGEKHKVGMTVSDGVNWVVALQERPATRLEVGTQQHRRDAHERVTRRNRDQDIAAALEEDKEEEELEKGMHVSLTSSESACCNLVQRKLASAESGVKRKKGQFGAHSVFREMH